MTKTDSGLYYGYYATTENSGYKEDANCTITGVIPCTEPLTFYIKGITSFGASSHDRVLVIYDNVLWSFSLNTSTPYATITKLDEGYYSLELLPALFEHILSSTNNYHTIDNVVLSLDNTTDDQGIIVSLEPIDSSTAYEYQWGNTGIPFVTAENVDGEIVVNGNVEFVDSIKDCVDVDKLYVVDGFIYAHQTKTVTKNPKDWIPESINPDGSQYVGDNGEDGYRPGYRINSSN